MTNDEDETIQNYTLELLGKIPNWWKDQEVKETILKNKTDEEDRVQKTVEQLLNQVKE